MGDDRLNYELIDSGASVLVTLFAPIKAIDGKMYDQIWGTASPTLVGGTPFVQLGGFTHEVVINPSTIRFIQACNEPPTGESVLCLANDEDEMAEGVDEEPVAVALADDFPGFHGSIIH